MGERNFELGNTVYAQGRVTAVEKVYANGNFKLAGLDGQWRQMGVKTGDHGYRAPRCEHYTEAVAKRLNREAAVSRLNYAAREIARVWRQPAHLTIDEIEGITQQLIAARTLLLATPATSDGEGS